MTVTAKRAIVSTPGERDLRIERVFDAPRERVWRAMTEPALIAQWWGRGNRLTVEKFDLRRGGHWRFVEHTADGRHGFEGRFREVEPPSKVVQTFEWDGMPGHATVQTMTLHDLGDGRTQLVVISQFMTKEERDGMLQSGMEGGMNQSYEALDRVLAAAEPARPFGGVRRVAFTMYPIRDAARARRFYEEGLGLRPGLAGGQGEMVWIEYDLPGGGCVALTNTTGDAPSRNAGGTLALEVEDLGAAIARVKEAGAELLGSIVRGPHCTMQMCLDSEGNSLLLHQLDADRPHADG
ncbi:MAG TPA: SRPBCC domain-containing protein [Kofleriaceae bacterium]|nr:SRPBCC domain-containing protein [Kofleriaceae bacterium]